ncbi:MAG: GAF domain-containing protein [Actinobacteria bacterium]|nr:MAG: GAF domain-containing protein [Actinomycetota bacterium]
MSTETKAVLFNAVPLFAVAAAYLAVAVAVAPRLWRDRAGLTANDLALALMFPCIGIPAAILGTAVLDNRNAIGGHLWFSFVASVIALLPALVFLARWGERGELLSGGARAREAEQLVTVRGRELEAVAAISDALARTTDPEAAGRVLLDEVGSVLGLEFTALALIDGEAEEARGFLARDAGVDVTWWRDVRIDLRNEPSGIASAYFQAAPVVVFDCSASPLVSPRLVEAVGAKSGAFVPLIVEERIVGVLVAAPTSVKRAFSSEEVTLMQSLAAEAALALERTRSAGALDEALARERLVGDISRRVRSVEGLADGTRIAVTEIGRALQASRCFIRLGEPGEPQRLAAEWFAAGLQPIGPQTQNLPAANLAALKRRTVVVSDIGDAPELDDPELGTTEALRRLGTKSLVATPMIALDRSVGVLGLHRATAGAWSAGEIALIESVGRELALAINSARLLDENQQRLLEQSALLSAAQVVTSELELEAVLQRLVDEVARLLECEAADCYLLDRERGTLRCAAVHGLEPELVGFEFSPDQGLAGRAIGQRAPALSNDYGALPDSVPHPAYRGYASAIVAPMMWSDQIRGVLGVGTHADRTLTSSDAELLEAFATLAALALRNAESFEERSRQARIQRAFYDIASLLAVPISQAETLRAVARAAAEALGGASSALLMPSEDAFELTAGHGLPKQVVARVERAAAAGAEPLATCARNGTVIAASALAEDDRFDTDWREAASAAGYGSLLAVPVQAPEGRDGLVVVFFEDVSRFSDYDLELARNLAGTARGALERSELYERERRARGLAQQLARTGTLLATELDPAAVLDEIVAQAPALLGADAAVVRLLEDDELVVSAAGGEVPDGLLDSRSPATGWAAADAIQMRAPVAIGDVEGEGPGASDPALAVGHRAFLAVPLVGSEGVMQGVLSVYARRPRSWQPEEVEALAALAGNASAALASAELYQRVALEKERSVAILANIADGIVAVDREGRVVLWNEAAERITGVRVSDAIGRSTEQVLQRTLASGDETSADVGEDRLLAIRRGDEDVWLSLTEAIMRDPAGAVAGRIFAFRDISAERVVEQMKSDFVTAVSHELRTPLTSIYGFAETLLRQDVLFGEEERRTFLGYIASESDRLTTIVDQLLNVARLDTGDLQVNLAPTDVRAVVSDVVQIAEQAPAANGHDFVVDLPEQPLDAEADADKLRQILANLVDNAIKFSPDGGRVTVGARANDEMVEVRVVDEGIGIPEEEQRRIFTKFYRGESMARDPSTTGTGLGLFIAHGLVTAMGGRMWVDSREGAGSSFAFELPLAAQAALSGQESA